MVLHRKSGPLLTNSIHETIDHSLYIQHRGLFTPIPDHRPLCLYNIMVSSHQFHTWDQLERRDHDAYTVIYGLMYGIGVKRQWCCIQIEWSLFWCMKLVRKDHQTIDHSVYTTSWYHHTNSIHETIDHSLYIQHHGLFTPIPDHRPLCLYNIMVSSHQFHTWDQEPLSVYATSWSLLTNSMVL
jgi:hypothetical protein